MNQLTFSVWCCMVQGTSESSDVLVVKTAFITSPDEPRNLTVLGTTGGSASLSWEAPLDLGGTDISSYEITFFAGYDTSTKFKQLLSNVSMNVAATLTAKLFGLNATTTYGIYVVGVNDISACVDASAFAGYTAVYATTGSVSAPEVPYNLNVTVSTTGMQEISWSPTTDRGADPVVRYVLFTGAGEILYNGTQTTFRRGSLLPNTTYEYSVMASNTAGTSVRSPVVSRKTTSFVTVPGTPTKLVCTSSKGGEIALSWVTPLDLGGDVLLGYRIFRDGALLPSLGSLYYPSTTYTDVNGLVAEKEYLYTVQAVNSHGSGVQSEPLMARTTVATVPAAPVSVNATAEGGTLAFTWIKSNDTGGVPLETYNVAIAKAGVVLLERPTADTFFTYYGIDANTNYTISIAAGNKIGYGPTIVRTVRNGNATRPQAPAPPEVVSFTSQSVVLALRGPLDDGGSDITSLKLYQNGVLVRTVQTNGYYQVVIEPLFARKIYSFSTTAVSTPELGESAPSSVLHVTTADPTPPSAVYDLTLERRTFGSLSYKWRGPDDVGGEAIVYEVEFYDTQDPTATATIVTSTPNATIDSLASSTTYMVRVRATNSAGKSAWTEAVQGDTDIAQRGEIVIQSSVTTVFENVTSVAFQLVRVRGISSTITCMYDVASSSTAVAGVNFVLADEAARRFVFLEGELQKGFAVQLLNDAVYIASPLELAITVFDTTPDRSEAVPSSTVSIFIADDGDAGWIDFANTTIRVREDAGFVDIPLQRLHGLSSSTSVRVSANTSDLLAVATAPADFSIATPVVTFADGETTQFVRVLIKNNSVYDFPPKQFALRVSSENGGGQIGLTAVVWITILDDGDLSPPGVIRDLVSILKTGGLIKLKWAPPVNPGGERLWITGYNLTITSDERAEFFYSEGNATEYAFRHLEALTQYAFQIAAMNHVSTGGFSAPIYETTMNYTRPGTVPGIALVNATGGLMTVEVSEPLDLGGAPILTYLVYVALAQDAVFEVRRVDALSGSRPTAADARAFRSCVWRWRTQLATNSSSTDNSSTIPLSIKYAETKYLVKAAVRIGLANVSCAFAEND